MLSKRLVIAGSCRTPYGEKGGSLRFASSQHLLMTCFKETVKRAGIEPGRIDEAVVGSCSHLSDAPNIARVAWLMAGLPEEVTGYSVQRNCGSGIQAAVSAIRAILAGDAEVCLVGGAESMSNTPAMLPVNAYTDRTIEHITLINSLTQGLTDPVTGELMWQTAENTVRKYGISREEQDEFAGSSHLKAFNAIKSGKFKSQIVPVTIGRKDRLGNIKTEIVSLDEGPDRTRNKQTLSLYPTLYHLGINGVKGTPEQIAQSTVTAGNACTLTDGAASSLILTLDKAAELGIEPEAEILSWGFAGVPPSHMGDGPIRVTPKLLQKAGLGIDDIDVFEVNEAFASIVVAFQKNTGVPYDKININGGGISLGHPVGASGWMLPVKAIYLLKERNETHALITLCVGGGQGAGIIIKNWAKN